MRVAAARSNRAKPCLSHKAEKIAKRSAIRVPAAYPTGVWRVCQTLTNCLPYGSSPTLREMTFEGGLEMLGPDLFDGAVADEETIAGLIGDA